MGATSRGKLVCRRCQISPELVHEEGGGDRLRCGRCGRGADLHIAGRLAAQHVNSQAIDDMLRRRRRRMAGSKHVDYVVHRRVRKPTPDFVYR